MEGSQSNIENNIDWGPLKSGGANFKTHKLVEVASQRMEYKASVGSIILGFIFLLVGLGVSSIVFFDGFSIFLLLFGVAFATVGVFILKSALNPIVFDKTEGYFWKGKKTPSMVSDINELKVATKLDDIYGIQVIKEYIKSSSKGKDTSYYSYEINLILNSGERLNVVDYGNANAILEDASRISKFLNKPILTQN